MNVFFKIRKKISASPLLISTTITVSLRVTGAFLLLVFNWAIVKLIGINDSGTFFLAYTIINFFSVFGLFGIDHSVLRGIPKQKNTEQRNLLFTTNLTTVTIISVISGLVLILTSGLLGKAFGSESLQGILVMSGFAIPLLCLLTYLAVSLQSIKQYWKSIFSLTNSYYLISIVVFIGMYILGTSTLQNITKGYIFSLFVSLIITGIFTKKYFSLAGRRPLITTRENLRKSSGLFIVSLLYVAFGWADILIVGYFLPESDVGIYSVAARLSKLLTFVLFAINIVLAPVISKNYKEKNMESLNWIVQKGTILSILFSLPIAIIMIVFSSKILGIFGSEFVAGVSTLRILVVGQAVNAFTGAVVVVMMMIGIERQLNIISSMILVFQIALGLLLTPLYGQAGTAISTMFGLCAVNILCAYYIYNKHRISLLPTFHTFRRLLKGNE